MTCRRFTFAELAGGVAATIGFAGAAAGFAGAAAGFAFGLGASDKENSPMGR
ncbi:MAG: hypothetical protein ABJO27_00905 [Pseudoruegeria sp.]